MAVARSQQGLEHFTRLNPAVYIHQPTSSNTSSSKDPDLIILAAWMNASVRNVSKYVAGYERLYPSAKIIVVLTSSTDLMIRSETANLNRVAPILEILYGLPPDVRFLVHAFSNGGALTASSIARGFIAKTGRQLPVTAMILDSSPGKTSYQSSSRAISIGLPKFFILRWLIISVLGVYFWVTRFLTWISGRRDAIEKMREELNTFSIFHADAPRLYIYGLKDYIIASQEIEEHVDDAKSSGYKVDTEKFVDTSHAGHLMGNDERYWGCVKRLWDTAH